MPLNYEKIEVRYKKQTPDTGLGSDGELVQAFTEEPSVDAADGGGGKANVESLSIIKYVDSGIESFDFALSDQAGAAPGGDDTPYDSEIAKEFRDTEAPPPLYDVDVQSEYPDLGQHDLIAWALDQIG